MRVWVRVLAQKYQYKNVYFEFETNCGRSVVAFYAIWGSMLVFCFFFRGVGQWGVDIFFLTGISFKALAFESGGQGRVKGSVKKNMLQP